MSRVLHVKCHLNASDLQPDTLEDPVELWDTSKCDTLEAAKECVVEHPRSWSGFASVETMDSIKESCAARLAGNHKQYRNRALLRKD